MADNNDKINLYHEIITNKVEKDDTTISQMDQWPFLSNVVNYVQYSRHPKRIYDLDIKAADLKSHKKIFNKEEKWQMLELDFGDTPEKLYMKDILDIYEGIQSKVISTTRFHENWDLSTTYLGRIVITRASKIKAEEKFPTSEQGYTIGKLLDGTECQMLLDLGESKSFMSKSHYLWCKSLHSLPKFASKMQRIWVGNEQFLVCYSLYQ